MPTSETTHSAESAERCPFHFGWVSKKRCRWPYAWEMEQKSRSSHGPRIECGFAPCLSPVERHEPAPPPTEKQINQVQVRVTHMFKPTTCSSHR